MQKEFNNLSQVNSKVKQVKIIVKTNSIPTILEGKCLLVLNKYLFKISTRIKIFQNLTQCESILFLQLLCDVLKIFIGYFSIIKCKKKLLQHLYDVHKIFMGYFINNKILKTIHNVA